MADTVDLTEITEYYDTPEELEAKINALVGMLTKAKHAIAFTGAGLSTAAKIPDFRGPQGVWTRAAQGKAAPECISLTTAQPTASHKVLTEWVANGRLAHIVSQNVDGLHLRSGLPRAALSEMHGNCFEEKCWTCDTSFLRDFEVSQSNPGRNGGKCPECSPVVPHFCHCTARSCPDCGGTLKDSVIHFSEDLPAGDLQSAFAAADQADLCLVVGSSCRVSPANEVPEIVGAKAGGALVIINLQATPLDPEADLVIHAKIDDVLPLVAQRLADQEVAPAAYPLLHGAAIPSSPIATEPEETAPEPAGVVVRNTAAVVPDAADGSVDWELTVEGPPEAIASVTYHLHPTFTSPHVTVAQPPFALKRRGWGTFAIDVDITSASGAVTTLQHPLSFSPAGTATAGVLVS